MHFLSTFEQDDAGAALQPELQGLREGFATHGVAWLRGELAEKTVKQLRALAGAAGVQQKSSAAGTLNKQELLDALLQCISGQEASWAKLLFCPAQCLLTLGQFLAFLVDLRTG